jgi:hypothetical protein
MPPIHVKEVIQISTESLANGYPDIATTMSLRVLLSL